VTFKEKNKTNPFNEALEPGETLLWSQVPEPMSFGAHFVRYLVMCVIGVVIIAFVFAALVVLPDPGNRRINPTGEPTLVLLATYTVSSTVVMAPLAIPLLLLFYPLLWSSYRRSTKSAYALTNRRLLTLTQGQGTETPLAQVDTIKPRGRDSLSFGKSHPTWHGIESPKTVAALIQQAKAVQRGS
jgi:hypothetical protein